MKPKRMWWTIRNFCTRGGSKRALFAKKNHIYAHVGNNVTIQSRMIPVYSELISFGNNVHIARNVDFVTHDIIHIMLNKLPEEEQYDYKFKEHIGCIEILDNVMIGSNSVIMYGTRIGPNVIIASGSVVTKDCEPNSVYAGCPAKKIGTLDDFVQKRIARESSGELSTTTHNQSLTSEEVENAWNVFYRQHSQ